MLVCGRAAFAATLLLIVGTINIIYGIGALGDANIFAGGQRFVFTNLNVLGWVTIILGLIQLGGGFSLLSGNTFGRLVAIVGAGLGALGALLSIGGATRGGRLPSSPSASTSSTGSSSSAPTNRCSEPVRKRARRRGRSRGDHLPALFSDTAV